MTRDRDGGRQGLQARVVEVTAVYSWMGPGYGEQQRPCGWENIIFVFMWKQRGSLCNEYHVWGEDKDEEL